MAAIMARGKVRVDLRRFRVKQPVIKDQYLFPIQVRRLGFLDDQRAIEPARHLFGRAVMRVIPVGSGIRHGKIIVEALPQLDRGLGQPGNTIHRIVYANPVPMHRACLGQCVHEAALQPRTLLKTHLRAGHRAAIAPDFGLGIAFRRQLNAGRAGVQGLEL